MAYYYSNPKQCSMALIVFWRILLVSQNIIMNMRGDLVHFKTDVRHTMGRIKFV